MSIEKLCRVCPPPTQPRFCGTIGAWRQIENKLQFAFPEDYKQCIDLYGEGEFGAFIYVLNPHVEMPGHSYFDHIDKILSAYTSLAAVAPDRLPFAIYPAKGGLLPAATSSNGNVVYWETKGDCQDWPLIVFASRHGQYERFRFGIVELIIRLLEGSLASDILPEDLPKAFIQ